MFFQLILDLHNSVELILVQVPEECLEIIWEMCEGLGVIGGRRRRREGMGCRGGGIGDVTGML